MDLYDQLIEYKEEGYYPMHMPGHKRNKAYTLENLYEIDITEIDGFDNLYEAEGVLEKSMQRAAKVFHADKTYYLVNGSTVGILIAISACTKRGDYILVARNSHKAVYNAIYLNELKPVYLYPEVGKEGIALSVTPNEVRKNLELYPNIKAVVITSPTYEGVISDIKEIAEIVHSYHIPLIVDEAHGAHLNFHAAFPSSAVKNGADIVIQSIHKTLPAFTQTALLHCCSNLIDQGRIKKYFSIYQTSSPSYVLMAGIDHLITYLEGNKEDFDIYVERLHKFYAHALKLKVLSIWRPNESASCFAKDPSKLIITVKNSILSGKAIYDLLLQKYKIQPEMASKTYVICMTSVCDTEEGFERLLHALLEIDNEYNREKIDNLEEKQEELQPIHKIATLLRPVKSLEHYEVSDSNVKVVSINKCVNKIIAEYIYLYPPGIPLIVPGEIMSKEILDQFMEYKAWGLSLKGMEDLQAETIKIIDS